MLAELASCKLCGVCCEYSEENCQCFIMNCSVILRMGQQNNNCDSDLSLFLSGHRNPIEVLWHSSCCFRHVCVENRLPVCGVRVWKQVSAVDSSYQSYRKTSDVRRTLEGNKIVDHSDVVGASPVGNLHHLHSRLNTWLQWIGQRQLKGETRNI